MKTEAKETSRKTSIQIYLEPAQRKQFTEVAKRKGIGEGTLGKIVLNEWLEKQFSGNSIE